MAAVTNPFTITYAGQAVGGASDIYLLHGPSVVDKSFATFRLVFDVIVKATSYANLKTRSETLEAAFRARMTHGQTLIVNTSGDTWTYTHGTDLFNAHATIAKSGNPETDRGHSRAYTIAIDGELPADDESGLRDVAVQVDYEAGRQRIVTMQGVYTALSGTAAAAQYQADFDAEATVFLNLVDSGATWEQVDEGYSLDRHKSDASTAFPHICNFHRQFAEVLFNQSSGTLDDTDVRDHAVTFSDVSEHPGDSLAALYRLRRVVGTYDCAADIEQTTDLQTLFDSKIKDHVRDTFVTNFSPQVYAVEDRRVSYDETAKRVSVSITFTYLSSKGSTILEMQQSVAYREDRLIDYTPVHGNDELAFDADLGWAVVERVWSRSVVAVGLFGPIRRIARRGSRVPGQIPGFFDVGKVIAGGRLDQPPTSRSLKGGWHVVGSNSQAMPMVIGDPDETQIKTTVLTETVVERLHNTPGVTGRRVGVF